MPYLAICPVLVMATFTRCCLLFSIVFNTFWIFFYLFASRSDHQVFVRSVDWPDSRPITRNPSIGQNAANSDSSPPSNPSDIYSLFHLLDSQVTQKPYIFVGGVPSSGTTLTRAMLDAHPDVRCGEETRLVPRILQMRERWRRSKIERKRLEAAGLNDTVVDKIVRNFVSSVIELHGPKAPHLCNKDPLALSQIPSLHDMFPNAKFVLMIRDGRAVANSIVSRNITISGVDHKSYVSAATFWNRAIEKMWRDCQSVGEVYCLPLYYEKLVQSPRDEADRLLRFLGIPWSENVMHHSDFLVSEVSLSK